MEKPMKMLMLMLRNDLTSAAARWRVCRWVVGEVSCVLDRLQAASPPLLLHLSCLLALLSAVLLLPSLHCRLLPFEAGIALPAPPHMTVHSHPPPPGAYGSSALVTGPQTEGTRTSLVDLV